jgi:hypothetical protein
VANIGNPHVGGHPLIADLPWYGTKSGLEDSLPAVKNLLSQISAGVFYVDEDSMRQDIEIIHKWSA